MSKTNRITFILVGLAFTIPVCVLADYGYLTMPLAASDTDGISSWFDHTVPLGNAETSTVGLFTRYNGVQYTGTSTDIDLCDKGVNTGLGCYDGHSGIDFKTFGVTGKNVLAAASGTVQQVQWYNPAVTTSGFGYFVRLWHGQYNLSTLYGHLDATSSMGIVSTGTTVARGRNIAVSGCTGICFGAHLHFQVYNADTDVNTSTGSHFMNSVDPYGWSAGAGQASDTWANDHPFGYMWASKFATSSYINTVTSSYLMTASTTWLADQTYIIKGSLTVSSTATLTIKQGAVVKFDATSTYLQVDGKLDVQGTASDPVYFTSIWDDTVGGDANDDATTTSPAQGNWLTIQLDAKSTTTIKNAIIRYGGHGDTGRFSNVFVNGGYLSATSTTFDSSLSYGIQVASGTIKITTSTFSNNGQYGVFEDGLNNLTITTSTFTNNTTAAGFIALQNGNTFTHTGNSASGNGPSGGTSGQGNGFLMQGDLAVTTSTWSSDTIPYILSNGVTIPSGKTLTINPGVVVKSDSVARPKALTVDGRFDVQGTSTNRVYFTSIDDDSVAGDTNNDGISTATSGVWGAIWLDGGSTSTIKNTVISYGGYTSADANVYVNGGYLSATSTTFASSSAQGLEIASGTVKITTSTFSGNLGYGIYLPSASIGNLTVTTSTFADNGGTTLGAAYVDYAGGAVLTNSGNTSTRNYRNGIIVNGLMIKNATWTVDLPYIIQGTVTVSSSKTLIVNPGVVVKFDNLSAQLIVNGTLNVKGTTSTNPIYFTSIKDDSVGGDANNDGTTTTPATGDWGNIQLNSGSSSTINYSFIRYGGHISPNPEVYLSGKLTARHDTIASSSYDGIYVADGSLNIASSSFTTDPGDGVRNATTAVQTATQNWWGSASGPFNAATNPGGTGTAVSDSVNYTPYLSSAPL